MRLTHRDLTPADIDYCLTSMSYLRYYDCYKPGLSEFLPKVWKSLLEAGAMQGDVVLDLDRPAESRIVGFGAGVFVTDSFVHEAETSLPPYVRAQLVERILLCRSPVLGAREIRANKVGPNLFIIGDMMHNPELSPNDLRKVMNKGIEAGLSRFRFFELRSWLSETYGTEAAQKVEWAGATVRRDYSEYFSQGSFAPTSCERPYLLGISRDEANSRDGSILSMLFISTPGLFRFRPVERVLLRLALQGETDEELASSLSISLSAVKKRWRGIYERIESADPTLIPLDAAPGKPDSRRGVEKRRHVLNYIREHLEELHPNLP